MDSDQPPRKDLDSTQTFEQESGSPQRIGHYRILQKLGEGGMGVVYLAEQAEPIRRRVALKVIKLGMDSKAVIARFEAERQALALMNHPNVAKVFDAGTTEQGRPYFAMEYVKGVPITEHCDRQRLTTAQRLRLFRQACDGVQHAHQKGIIHRDLKPSNVLVAIEGDKAVPKIIDFGVAKATEHRLTEQTVFTQLGQIIGTPEYMSPEQAEMTTQDIDTRTDVYSLGVILYELLVGALPFDSKELRQAGFDEIRRKIREEEPSRPSTRISSLGDASPASAKKRQTDPASLIRQLRGDLDWITMKSLEKDRTRRYDSPSELSADLERYLKDQPVLASPPSAAYRARKFVRRHKVGVSAAVAGVLVLAGFAVTMTVQAGRIADQRDRANRETAAKDQVLESLKNLFKVLDPEEARGDSITARELLDRGVKKIDETLIEQPETRAELMDTIGVIYHNLGLYEPAEQLLVQAIEIRVGRLGNDHPDTLASMNNLAFLYYRQNRIDDAEPLFLDTLEARKRVLGDDHPDTLKSMANLANLYRAQGQYGEAEPLYRETLEAQKRVLGDDHPDTLWTLHDWANLYLMQGQTDKAEPLYLEALEGRKRVLGMDHPETMRSISTLAQLHMARGRYDEAETLSLELLEARKRVLGDDHPDTLGTLAVLAGVYGSQGRYGKAEQLLLKVVRTTKRVFGEHHSHTLMSRVMLVGLYQMQGRYDKAERLYIELIETQKLVLGDDHPRTLMSMGGLIDVYIDQDRYDEAERLFLEVIETQKRVLGDDNPETLLSLNLLADVYRLQGRYDESEQLYLETHANRRHVLGAEHEDTLRTLNDLGNLYMTQENFDEANRLYLANLEVQRRVLGDDHWETLISLYNLACVEALRGDRAKAMDWLRQGIEAGETDADWMSEDPDLASLHGPEFDALVERVRQNATGQKGS